MASDYYVTFARRPTARHAIFQIPANKPYPPSFVRPTERRSNVYPILSLRCARHALNINPRNEFIKEKFYFNEDAIDISGRGGRKRRDGEIRALLLRF